MGERVNRRQFIRFAGYGLAAYVVGRPLWQLEQTTRIIRALAGQPVDCSGNPEQGREYPYDVIAVPGSGIVSDENGGYIPDAHSRLRLEGAAIVYEQQQAPNIVLLNGMPYPPNDGMREKEYIQHYAAGALGIDIPDDAIILEQQSINTATNFSQLRTMLDNIGLHRSLVVPMIIIWTGLSFMLVTMAWQLRVYLQSH
jgi:uncharacterized SAM-binding protein YcdF (DUF218 family)